jgi:hypothetical protein
VAALVLALTGTIFTAMLVTSPSPTTGTVTSPSSPAVPGPRAVVLAYIAAINSHNWHRVWALGGKNFSPSYQDMVAGYRLTAHDGLTSLRVHGDTVYAHLLARKTTGEVQRYRVRYVVHGGVITAGHATRLVTG